MTIAELVNINFDLLSVAVSITGIALLGVLIYFNNPTSITNRTFLIFAILTALWGVSNYLEYRFETAAATLTALRVHLFLSVFHAYYFFRLAWVFPARELVFPRWYRFFLTPLAIFTAFLTLTPLVFSGINTLVVAGQVTRATPAPGIALFMVVAFGLLISALATLARKTWKARGIERRQNASLLAGMTLTALLLLSFNVILPNVFSDLRFIPLAALFILPFIGLTSYTIYRHHLFNLKVATAAFLGFMVSIFTFVNVLYSRDLPAIIINVTAFAIVLLGSIKIVRDTLDLQIAKDNLEAANEQQESLLHFISHEVKGYFTRSEAAFAAISDGSFGPVTEKLKLMASEALADTRNGVETVMDILDASNLKKGTVAYDKKPFDFSATVRDIAESLKAAAAEKGVSLTVDDRTGVVRVNGDENKIRRHVIRNLIDNAIRYTPSGAITVSVSKNGTVRLEVKDTGVGISPDDRGRLFKEGGRGADSIKVNVHSTGYGLFIAKQIVETHGGTICAESEGKGKGSRFIVELPPA